MATYTTNDTRHVIVLNSYEASVTEANAQGKAGYYIDTKKVGDTAYIQYVNGAGELMRTDLFKEGHIEYIKAVAHTPKVLRQDELVIDEVVPGQEYGIKIVFRQAGSGSSEDKQIEFVGGILAKTGDNAASLYKKLYEAANKNFKNKNLLKFTLDNTETPTKITISEVNQHWSLARFQDRPLDYTIFLVSIDDADGQSTTDWGHFVDSDGSNAGSVANGGNAKVKGKPGVGTGHEAADLEAFYLKERGAYGQFGWPYNVSTTYLADSSAAYDIIDIKYNEQGEGVYVQKSEKGLLILCKQGAEGAHTIADQVAEDFNLLSMGVSINKLTPVSPGT